MIINATFDVRTTHLECRTCGWFVDNDFWLLEATTAGAQIAALEVAARHHLDRNAGCQRLDVVVDGSNPGERWSGMMRRPTAQMAYQEFFAGPGWRASAFDDDAVPADLIEADDIDAGILADLVDDDERRDGDPGDVVESLTVLDDRHGAGGVFVDGLTSYAFTFRGYDPTVPRLIHVPPPPTAVERIRRRTRRTWFEFRRRTTNVVAAIRGADIEREEW